MGVIRPVMRYHGGKFRLAPWVIRHFPPHRCYVEPYGGAAGVLVQKDRAYAEVYNDLDGDVVNLFRVLRSPSDRALLVEQLTLTPYARDEFEAAYEVAEDPVERARRTLIRAEMGFGSAGATKGATGFRVDTRRVYGTAQDLWRRLPATLSAVGERLSGVMIENRPALDVIRQHDGPDVLFYIDPPYIPEARQPGRFYAHEMSREDHLALLDLLTGGGARWHGDIERVPKRAVSEPSCQLADEYDHSPHCRRSWRCRADGVLVAQPGLRCGAGWWRSLPVGWADRCCIGGQN
ncbi:modification methylase [Bordetella ansorpii]|uniref:Modification methylase n=1 Tax=Bordetella ansorpii TaxID=288768 RepID=A0A157RNG1_9BORD|nr:modification methylase [Bordetella ansorpii]